MQMMPLLVHGRLMDVRCWWDRLVSIGPDFGYFPNPSKTCLIVKDCFYDSAVSIFKDSGVCITAEGKRHLGAALHGLFLLCCFLCSSEGFIVAAGTHHFIGFFSYSTSCSLCCFVHGVVSRWNYLIRCIPNVCKVEFQPDL